MTYLKFKTESHHSVLKIFHCLLSYLEQRIRLLIIVSCGPRRVVTVGPWTSSISNTWKIVRNASSQAHLLEQKLGGGVLQSVLTRPPHNLDTHQHWRTRLCMNWSLSKFISYYTLLAYYHSSFMFLSVPQTYQTPSWFTLWVFRCVIIWPHVCNLKKIRREWWSSLKGRATGNVFYIFTYFYT